MPQTAPMDATHWQTIISVLISLVGLLITFLLWQISNVKGAVSKSIDKLFEKIDALAANKVSTVQCKEYRDLCFRDCPYRRREEHAKEA